MHLRQSDEQSNQANGTEYEVSPSVLHRYHPHYFSETALEYHHNNNISAQKGAGVSKGI